MNVRAPKANIPDELDEPNMPTKMPKIFLSKGNAQKIIQNIMKEERERPPRPIILLDQKTKTTVSSKLQRLAEQSRNVNKEFGKWFQIAQDEPRLKAFVRLVSVSLVRSHTLLTSIDILVPGPIQGL